MLTSKRGNDNQHEIHEVKAMAPNDRIFAATISLRRSFRSGGHSLSLSFKQIGDNIHFIGGLAERQWLFRESQKVQNKKNTRYNYCRLALALSFQISLPPAIHLIPNQQ